MGKRKKWKKSVELESLRLLYIIVVAVFVHWAEQKKMREIKKTEWFNRPEQVNFFFFFLILLFAQVFIPVAIAHSFIHQWKFSEKNCANVPELETQLDELCVSVCVSNLILHSPLNHCEQ